MNEVLTPMNHREIEYNAKKLSGCDIPDSFAYTIGSIDSVKCKDKNSNIAFNLQETQLLLENGTALLKWLDETGDRVFDKDLVMDYGTDCLRLYLLFEQTPKENDAPFYDSWKEGALEGIYKFLGRYRRMILVADVWNKKGNYNKEMLSTESICRLKEALENTTVKIKKSISRGNTMSNRHNIVSSLMQLLNIFQKELKIGEIVTKLHTHAVEMAVPHSSIENKFEIEQREDQIQNSEVTKLCQEFIALMAPYAPSLSVALCARQCGGNIALCRLHNHS